MNFGITNTGTQTPPNAASMTTNVAPKGADCSCVFAIVPNNNPSPMAARPANNATIYNKGNLPDTSNSGNPIVETNIPLSITLM